MSRLTGRCMNISSRGGNLKQYEYMSMRQVLCLAVWEAVVHRQVLCLAVREAVVHRQIMKNAL